MTLTHQFDWHQEPEGSFLKWAMVNFGTEDGIFQKLSDATDHFKNIELKITVSGVEVDAKKFADELDRSMDWAVEREAKKIIEGMPRLHELYDTLHSIEVAFREQVFRAAAEAGIEMRDEDFR